MIVLEIILIKLQLANIALLTRRIAIVPLQNFCYESYLMKAKATRIQKYKDTIDPEKCMRYRLTTSMYIQVSPWNSRENHATKTIIKITKTIKPKSIRFLKINLFCKFCLTSGKS